MNNTEPVGFAAYEINYKASLKTKIHKIYVLPQTQGMGVGRSLLQFVGAVAIEHKNEALVLNVNRFNKATSFYEKLGFVKMYTEDIDIGNGFLMEDFVMEKSLKNKIMQESVQFLN